MLPSKLWETWGHAICHSFLYLLGDQHKGETTLPKNTVFRLATCRCRSFRTCKPRDALHLLPVSSSLLTPSLHCCLAKKDPLYCTTPLEPGVHDACTLMGNVLAASDIFGTEMEKWGADVGSTRGTSLTSRTFRDPDSLKEGLQRKFICRLNTHDRNQ